MKIKLLLLVIITTVWFKTPLLLAQDVFPKSDAIWVIHMYSYNPPAQYIYGLSGDTIINEMTYQKLYLLNDTTLTITDKDIYVAGIRQTESKQVWILPADNKDGSKFEEYLMYDFGKNIGEEINFGKKIYIDWNTYELPTFEDIRQELYEESIGYIDYTRESIYGTVYVIKGDVLGEEWIKGIGSLSGLFFYPLNYSLCGGVVGCELICMKQQNEIKYKSDNYTSCFNTPFRNTNGINDISNDSNLSVYYDKKQDSIIIESENTNSLIFNLYKLDGTSVFSSTISDANTFVNVNEIAKGMYIYNVAGENINQSGKLIIR